MSLCSGARGRFQRKTLPEPRDLAPGGRLEIPLGVFVAAFGQNFDPKKQVPFGIEVTAVAADGKPVKIVWGKGRRR